MFLKEVNKHSKPLLFLMISFIIVQLFINYKRGLLLSPFLNYGMYSEVINIKNSYDVFEVEQNGKRLRGQDFTPEEWDKIILPLQYYAGINRSNELYQTEITRLLGKVGISSKEITFVSTCNYQQFENWYKNYLPDITNQKTETLAVTYRSYHYDSNRLKATNQFLPLSQLCH